MSNDEDETAAQLLNETGQNISALVQAELALLKSALSKSLSRLFLAIGLIVFAAVIVLVACNVLATTSVAALVGIGFTPVWAGLGVGLGLVVMALLLVKIGAFLLKRALRGVAQPVRNLGRDANAVKAAYYEQ